MADKGQKRKKNMSLPAYQLRGLVAVKGKRGQTKGQVKGLMTQSDKGCASLSDTSVPTPLPVQLVVVSLPAEAGQVASLQSCPARSISPNSLVAVVRRRKEVACTNGTS